jgi:hypothetical protein
MSFLMDGEWLMVNNKNNSRKSQQAKFLLFLLEIEI